MGEENLENYNQPECNAEDDRIARHPVFTPGVDEDLH